MSNLLGFKELGTTEYALDVDENDNGSYSICQYRLNFDNDPLGGFYKSSDAIIVESLDEVYAYIEDFPLGPSCYINQLVFTRVDISELLTEVERNFIDRLEVLSRHANIREILVIR